MKENLRQLELALKEAKQPDQRLTAMLRLLIALERVDFPRCEMFAIEAIRLATTLNRPDALAKAHESAGTALWKMAEFLQSAEHYDLALDQFLALDDLHGVAKCYIGKGIICSSLDEYRTALEHFEHALVASKKAGSTKLSATIVGNIGHVYFNIGRYSDAMRCFETGLDFYTENDNAEGSATMVNGMAGVFVYQGKLEKGLEFVRRGLRLHQKAKHPRGEAVTMMNIGITLRKMGRHEKAKRQLLDALSYMRSIQFLSVEFQVHENLAQVYSELGREDESAKHMNAYLELEKEEKRASLKRSAEQREQRLKFKDSEHKNVVSISKTASQNNSNSGARLEE